MWAKFAKPFKRNQIDPNSQNNVNPCEGNQLVGGEEMAEGVRAEDVIESLETFDFRSRVVYFSRIGFPCGQWAVGSGSSGPLDLGLIQMCASSE